MIKKIILIVFAVFCFIQVNNTYAFTTIDTNDDINDNDSLWNNRLYSSTADNSIYWVVDYISFISQQYWYIYYFGSYYCAEGWAQPINTQALDIADFYSYLDTDNKYIIFDIKAWETAYMLPWVDETSIGVFTRSVGWNWQSLNGRCYTYFNISHKNYNTIENLLLTLDSLYGDIESSISSSYVSGVADAIEETSQEISHWLSAYLMSSLSSLSVYVGYDYVWDNSAQELYKWSTTYNQYNDWDWWYGSSGLYNSVKNDVYYALGTQYALILSSDLKLSQIEYARSSGYQEGKADGKAIGKLEGIEEGIKQGIEQAYYYGFSNTDYEDTSSYSYAVGYNQGQKTSFNGFTLILGFIFSALGAFGNIEIIPGLKLWYICGIMIVFGLIGFITSRGKRG